MFFLGRHTLFQLGLFPHLNLPEVSIPVTNLKTSFSNYTRCLRSRKIVRHVHPHLFKHIHCRLGDDVNIANNYVISRLSILVEIHVKKMFQHLYQSLNVLVWYLILSCTFLMYLLPNKLTKIGSADYCYSHFHLINFKVIVKFKWKLVN